MNIKIEDIVTDEKKPRFKSEGERRIAYFLDNNSIKYLYEPGILVNSIGEKPRIWYPDFYLPEFKTYIEFFGLTGNQSYNRGIKLKESTYSKMGLDVISIYPWMFNKNWEGYVMRGLKRNISRSYRNLENKPFWSQNRPSLNSYRPKSAYRRQNTNWY
jgi:hypothetical protein